MVNPTAHPMRRSRSELLDPRARHLLRALIGQYIRDGEPVGSRTLARASGLDLSPATIRNVLSDLEELGLIRAPHTSAGRVPTAQGYRLFVDALLELKLPTHDEVEHWQHNLQHGQNTQDVLHQASSVLSQLTQFVGVVTVPKRSQFAFKQIDFVRLSPTRLLVILVFTDNEVQNRVVDLARPFAPGEREEIANFLNANYAGLALDDIRARLVGDLEAARDSIDRLMRSAIEIADASFRIDAEAEMLLAGTTNLMAQPELADLERLRELFEAFQRKRELVRLMEQCIHADGVRLFIGEESGYAPLGQCSMVTAPYGAGGRVLGVLGVIGPTRMAYERVIPVVQTTAQLLSRSLARLSG